MKAVFTILLCLTITASFAQTENNETTIVDDMYGKSEKSLVEVKSPKVSMQMPKMYGERSALSLMGAAAAAFATVKWSNNAYANGNSRLSYQVLLGGAMLTTGLLASCAYNFTMVGGSLVENVIKKRKTKKRYERLD